MDRKKLTKTKVIKENRLLDSGFIIEKIVFLKKLSKCLSRTDRLASYYYCSLKIREQSFSFLARLSV